jgi:prefoldin alpha subunit
MNEKERFVALEQQLIQQNFMNLKNHLATLNMQVDELIRIKEDLLSLKDVKDEKTFVPLGAGIFLEAVLKQPKEVVLNVGANVLVKKDFDSASKILEKQVTELKNIQSQLESELNRLQMGLISK